MSALPHPGRLEIDPNLSERLVGTSGDDMPDGSAGADTPDGDEVQDLLRGGQDNDTLNGERGDDRLLGGYGANTVYVRAGNDTIVDLGPADRLSIPGSSTPRRRPASRRCRSGANLTPPAIW